VPFKAAIAIVDILLIFMLYKSGLFRAFGLDRYGAKKMSYEETLRYIHNVKWQGSKPGLSRTRSCWRRWDNPEKALKFVHIAAQTARAPRRHDRFRPWPGRYTTGLYTSPYILRFNERMQVNGAPISDADLEMLTDEIRPFCRRYERPADRI
jgi:dihydrofolate synthase/folylpolyglutamate synthase